LMGPRKRLRKARRCLAAAPHLASAVRRSVGAVLAQEAARSPDPVRAAEAARALGVLVAGGWADPAFDELGVALRARVGRAALRSGGPR
jgi:hypothetical protein